MAAGPRGEQKVNHTAHMGQRGTHKGLYALVKPLLSLLVMLQGCSEGLSSCFVALKEGLVRYLSY